MITRLHSELLKPPSVTTPCLHSELLKLATFSYYLQSSHLQLLHPAYIVNS